MNVTQGLTKIIDACRDLLTHDGLYAPCHQATQADRICAKKQPCHAGLFFENAWL